MRRPGVYTPRHLAVIAAERPTPLVRRVTLAGPQLEGFEVPSRAMAPYLKLVLPPPGGDDADTAWPFTGPDGGLVWSAGANRALLRTYSVRRIDAERQTLTLDVVLHGEGPGATWGREVGAGDCVRILGPGAPVPDEAGVYVLAGDLTALPAIAFVLERLPASARGTAIVEVPDAAEEQVLLRPPGIDVIWLHRPDPARPSLLPDAVGRSLPAHGEAAFLFAGAEAAIARAIRRYARRQLRLPASSTSVMNYWKRGCEEGAFRYV